MVAFFFALTFLCSVIYALEPHICEHDSADHMLEARRAPFNRMASLDDGHTLAAADRKRQTAAPMRFQFDTTFLKTGSNYCSFVGKNVGVLSEPCTADDVLTPEREALLLEFLGNLEQWLELAFEVVRPVVGRLRLNAGSCGVQGGVTVPTAMVNPGVANVDTVAFVTAWPTGSAAAAYAVGCRFDSVARPTAGHINIAPATIAEALATNTDESKDFVFKVMMHEIFHVLGFNSGDWAWYVNPSTGQSLGQAAVIDFSPSGFFSKPVHVVKLPAAQSAARAHFNCPSLAGVELEDRDTSNRASNEPSSHLEKRVYNQELMNAVVWPTGIRVSSVSLATLGASGWYNANMSQAESMEWGSSAGCTFATGKCSGWTDQYEICSLPTDRGCTFDRRGRGYCGLNNYGAGVVPSYAHSYLVDNTVGGEERLDFCPIIFPWSNGLCADQQAGSENWPWGESYGDQSSRCVESTLLQNGAQPASLDGRCFQHRCGPDDELQLLVKSLWIECPKAGGPVSVPGYTGELRCPVSTELCCSPRCAAGSCLHGTCFCDPGYQGAACTACRGDAGPSCAASTAPAPAPAAPGDPQVLIAAGASSWRHTHQSSAIAGGLAWSLTGYTEPGWQTGGTAPFGSAGAGLSSATSLSSSDTHHYYRATFQVTDTSKLSWLRIRLAVAAAADVYVNGLPVDEDAKDGSLRTASFWTRTVSAPASILVQGNNVVAVHTTNGNGAAAFMDLELATMCPLCQPPTPAPTPPPTPAPTPLAPPPPCSVNQVAPKAHGGATRTVWAAGGDVGVDQALVTEVARIMAVNYAPSDVGDANTAPGAAFTDLDSTGRTVLDPAKGLVEFEADTAMGGSALNTAFGDTLDVVLLQGNNAVVGLSVGSGSFSAARTAALSLFYQIQCSRALAYFVVPFAARSSANYDTDQDNVIRGYGDIVTSLLATSAGQFVGAVPVGRAFQLVRDGDQASSLNPFLSGSEFYGLYESGGERASATGRYLAALVTQVALTGFPPTSRSAASPPVGLSAGRVAQFRAHATQAVLTELWQNSWAYAWARKWTQPNTTAHFTAWGQDRWLVDGGCCSRAQLLVDPDTALAVTDLELNGYSHALLSPTAVSSLHFDQVSLGPRSSAEVNSGLVRVSALVTDGSSPYSVFTVRSGTAMIGGCDVGGQIRHIQSGTMIWSPVSAAGTGLFTLRPTTFSQVYVELRDFLIDDPALVIRVELNGLDVPSFSADRTGSAPWGVMGVAFGRCELLRGTLELRQTTRGSTATAWFTVVSARNGLVIGAGFTVTATDGTVNCRQALAGSAQIPSLQCRFGPPQAMGETNPAATAATPPPGLGIRFDMLLPGSLAAADRLELAGFAVRVSCPNSGIINLGRGQFGCFNALANEDPATAAVLSAGQRLLVEFMEGRTGRLKSVELSSFVEGTDLAYLELDPSGTGRRRRRRRSALAPAALIPLNTTFWEAVPGDGDLSGEPVISSFSVTSQSGSFSLDAFSVVPESGPLFTQTDAGGNGNDGAGAADCVGRAAAACLLPLYPDCCVFGNQCFGAPRDSSGFCLAPPSTGTAATDDGGLLQAGFCSTRTGLWCSDDLGSELRCQAGVVQAVRDCGGGCRQVLDGPDQSDCRMPGQFMAPDPGVDSSLPGGTLGTTTASDVDGFFANFPNPGAALGLSVTEFYGIVGLVLIVLCVLCVCASIFSRRRAAAREREARHRHARHDWATDLEGDARRQVVLKEMAVAGRHSSHGGRDFLIVTVDIPELRAQKKMKFDADMITSEVRAYVVNSVVKRGLWPSNTRPTDYQMYLNYTNSGAALLSNLSLRDNAVKTNHRIILKKKPRDDDDGWTPDIRPPHERRSPRKRSAHPGGADPETEALKREKARMEREIEEKKLQLAEVKRQARQEERERAAKDFVSNLGGIEVSDDESNTSNSLNVSSSSKKKKVVRRRSRAPSASRSGRQSTMNLAALPGSDSSSDEAVAAVVEMVHTEAPVAKEMVVQALELGDDDDSDDLPVVNL